MQNDIDAILISAGDDVVTLTREAPMGKTVRYLDGGDMAEIISLGAPKFHKIAVRNIPAGCEIKKYGEVIGRATCDIKKGEHVQCHNITSGVEGGERA